MNIALIADEISRENGDLAGTSIPAIAFWLTSNVGRLNNLIDTNFVIEAEQIHPEPSDQEKVIFKLLYLISYFERQVSVNLGAAAYTTILEVKEGNRTVRRANKNDVAKNYLAFVNSYRNDLRSQINSYRMNAAQPLDVLVPNPILEEDVAALTYNQVSTTRRSEY